MAGCIDQFLVDSITNRDVVHGYHLGCDCRLYLLSNAGLYFVREEAFRNVNINVLLVGLDTVVLTASLMISGQVETSFYLAYFLLIIICCTFENPRMIAIVSFFFPAIISYSLFCSLSEFFLLISHSWFALSKPSKNEPSRET